MRKYRFGFKGSGLFPNAGIVVFALSDAHAETFASLLDQAKALLVMAGHAKIASRIVFEPR